MGTRNKLLDLNDNLFEAMERVLDADLSTPEGQKELEMGKTVADIGAVIVNNAKIVLTVQRLYEDGRINDPKLLIGDKAEEEKNDS